MTETSERVELAWNDLPASLRALFDVWVGGGGVKWAQMTWTRLAQKHVNVAAGPHAVPMIRLRALALAVYYQSFCSAAWQVSPPILTDSAQDAALSFNDIFALAGPSPLAVDDVDEEDYELFLDLLLPLLEDAYGEVSSAIEAEFPNVNLRFVYLWLSRGAERAGVTQLTREELEEVLNADLDEKGEAYEWLRNGAAMLVD